MHLICTFFAYIDTSSIDNSMKYLTHLVIDESNPVQSCCNTSFCLWQSAIAKLFDVGHSMPNQHTIKSVSTDFVQISFTSWISCYFTSAQISDRSAKWCGRYGCISFGRVQRIESGRMYTIGYIFHIFQHVAMNLVSMESAFDSPLIDIIHDTLRFMNVTLTLKLCALWHLTHVFGECPLFDSAGFFWYVTTHV